MKKRIILVISILLIFSGIFLLIRIAAATLKTGGRGALQVTSNIKAGVILDNKVLGSTPLCLCDEDKTLPSGTHDLKIIPEDTATPPFLSKVDINPGVLTAVDRTFLPGSLASYYILTLEKKGTDDAQIFIASIPDGALVSIDTVSRGVTPFSSDISVGEHEVEIEKSGFAKKTVRIRAVKAYKLILNASLGVEGAEEEVGSTPIPTPQASPQPTAALINSIRIKETPTGFLRVRSGPSTGSSEIGQVKPGETFEFVDENASWYKIVLDDGQEGWVSKTYAESITQ